MIRSRAARSPSLGLVLAVGAMVGLLDASALGLQTAHAATWVDRAEPEPDGESQEPEADGEEETTAAATPKWITHKVVPRESLDTIAMRYGVTRGQLERWNKKKLGKRKWIYAGQKLKVHANLLPPPREKITYEVQRGDTWSKIAAKYNVDPKDLRGWNPKVPKAFRAGTDLTVYTNPVAPPPGTGPAAGGGSGSGGPMPTFSVRKGGIGVGKPNKGKLLHGVPLPKSDMVKILDEDKVYGTSHTIEQLQSAIAAFRRDSGYDQPLTISSISLKNGGRFRPHSSHQTGRDVDIRLPRKPGASRSTEAPSSVDWTLTYHLIKALVATGEVQYIFVSWSRQKYLRRAAKSAGATEEELDKLVQYPRKPNTNKGIVRHSPGHTVHLHVRFNCTPGNARCKSY